MHISVHFNFQIVGPGLKRMDEIRHLHEITRNMIVTKLFGHMTIVQIHKQRWQQPSYIGPQSILIPAYS